MADTTPPPSGADTVGFGYPPPPPPAGHGFEPQPPYDGPTGSHRGLKVLVLSVVLALMVGGGAFAFYQADPFHLFRAGPQASEALPADAIFYAGVDLDPTASQKINALRFLNHFPSFRENAGLSDVNADVREALLGKAIDKLHCAGVDYEHDVKPWLGERFGIAVMPPTSADTTPVAVAIQVSDDDAATKGIAALNACDDAVSSPLDGGSSLGISFVNGFMLLSDSQPQADAYATSAGEHALADDVDFKADIGSLGDLGVATMWVDAKAAVAAYGDKLPQAGDLTSLTSSLGRYAATFRFASDHVEVEASAYSDNSVAEVGDNPVVKLPGSTVLAISASGGDQRVAQAWKTGIDEARSVDPQIDEQISQFERQTGFSLPADIETLFGHNLMLALDQQGLTADNLRAGDPSTLSFGARFTNDPAKLDALYTKLVDLIDSANGGQVDVAKKDFPDGVAIASNEAYAQRLGGLDGDLGDTDAFRSVVDDGAGQAFVMFVNVDAVKSQILEAMTRSGVSQEVIDNLRPLKAFGVSGDVQGHYQHVTMRLSVDD